METISTATNLTYAQMTELKVLGEQTERKFAYDVARAILVDHDPAEYGINAQFDRDLVQDTLDSLGLISNLPVQSFLGKVNIAYQDLLGAELAYKERLVQVPSLVELDEVA